MPLETREKIAAANKGHVHTEESKEKMRHKARLSWQRRKMEAQNATNSC
jgi:hypothetical protein